MAPPSRIQLVHRRLRVARYSLGALALTAFAAFGVAVRASHPATHTQPAVATVSSDDESAFSFDDDGASISPTRQSSVPTIQSGGS